MSLIYNGFLPKSLAQCINIGLPPLPVGLLQQPSQHVLWPSLWCHVIVGPSIKQTVQLIIGNLRQLLRNLIVRAAHHAAFLALKSITLPCANSSR